MVENTAKSAGLARPQMHPEQKAEDPRSRAAARAAEILGHLDSFGEVSDKFHIPADIVPDGWTYEWKEYTLVGAIRPAKQVELQRMGWEPVPANRHPEMLPPGSREQWILVEDMRLMERPKEVTDKVKAFELKLARDQVRSKEEALNAAPPGTLDRNNKDHSLVSVRKSYERMPVAD